MRNSRCGGGRGEGGEWLFCRRGVFASGLGFCLFLSVCFRCFHHRTGGEVHEYLVRGEGGVWCGVVWCGVVAWCCVALRGVVWHGVWWRGVVWCGVVWCVVGGVWRCGVLLVC